MSLEEACKQVSLRRLCTYCCAWWSMFRKFSHFSGTVRCSDLTRRGRWIKEISSGTMPKFITGKISMKIDETFMHFSLLWISHASSLGLPITHSMYIVLFIVSRSEKSVERTGKKRWYHCCNLCRYFRYHDHHVWNMITQPSKLVDFCLCKIGDFFAEGGKNIMNMPWHLLQLLLSAVRGLWTRWAYQAVGVWHPSLFFQLMFVGF